MDVVINASNNHLPSGAMSLNTHGDFWINTLAQLGQDPVYTPLADLFRIHHQLKEGEWLIVSPIHWRVTHNDAMIVACGEELGLTETAASIWFAEISEFLVQDGLKLIHHSPYCWLLNAVGQSPLTSPNLPCIQHQSLMPILEKLDRTMYWQRLFTELQMALASHPLNTAPDSLMPVNGVWFWGAGQLLTKPEASLRPIVTDDPIIQASFTSYLPLDLAHQSFEESTLFSIRYPNDHVLEQLENIVLRQKTVNWYWNNSAYQMKLKPWYKRLLERRNNKEKRI